MKTQYLAADIQLDKVFGTVTPPKELGNLKGAEGINTILTNMVSLIFTVSAVLFVFMFLISGFQMLMSGGDKEALAKARARLTWAVIGIVLLSLSFVILRIIQHITGFNFILI